MKKTKIGVRKPFTTMNKMEGKLRKNNLSIEDGSIQAFWKIFHTYAFETRQIYRVWHAFSHTA